MLLGMQITLAAIGSRSTQKDGLEPLVQGYLERCSAWAQCRSEVFKTEEALLEWLGRQQGRTQAKVVLLDSRWTEGARKQAHLQLSLGEMTLAHALARLVMAEQIYRAYTILTGHPYHAGH